MTTHWLKLVLGLAVGALSTIAAAEPQVGVPLPSFTSTDINGRTHATRELSGQPSIVIVVPSRAADDPARRWLDQIGHRNTDAHIRVITLISVRLPPLVPAGVVRRALRAKVRPSDWDDVWLDGSGSATRAFDLGGNTSVPHVIAMNSEGHVIAAVHSAFTPTAGQPIWSALGSR